MTDISPDARLLEAAQAIHADNLHLLARLDANDCNPGIELDSTLNGAQEHIFRFFEALAVYRYGTVPWRNIEFMLDSTEALVHAIETKFHTPSAHAVGQAFRASKIWWCVDEPAPKVTRKAYLKNLFAARDSFYAALNNFNCDIFCQGSPPPAQQAATKRSPPAHGDSGGTGFVPSVAATKRGPPYTVGTSSLHGGFGFPTPRVWLPYTGKRDSGREQHPILHGLRPLRGTHRTWQAADGCHRFS